MTVFHRVCVRLIKRKNIMSPQETLALQANLNDEFNFYAMERILVRDYDDFKTQDLYIRFVRRYGVQKSA